MDVTSVASSSSSEPETRRPASAHSKCHAQFASWAASNAAPVDLSVPSSAASPSNSSNANNHVASSLSALPVFANASLSSGLISSFGKHS